MKRYLLVISITAFLFILHLSSTAQTTQTVDNGQPTAAINFPGAGCTYNWVNNLPGIGLPASGTSNIPSFLAVNNGKNPVTATITATPVLSNTFYVANAGDNTISVIDGTTNLVTATIPVGSKPLSLSVSADGSKVYVANSGDNTVSVINTATGKVINVITNVNSPYCIKVSPNVNLIYVSNYNAKTVTVINGATTQIVATIPLTGNPANLCVSNDGTLVYVITGNGNLAEIDAKTNKVINNINTGGTFSGISSSADGSFIYLTNTTLDYIAVINTSTFTSKTAPPFSGDPYDAVVGPDDNTAYASIFKSGMVKVINLATNSVVSQIPVGTQPQYLFLSADNKFVYVADVGSGDISVISTSTNQVVSTIPVGKNPNSIDGFASTAATCPPLTFTITVNPSPPLTILAGIASGSISGCAGSASSSPDVLQFTVTGILLNSPITAAAPPNFEISLTPAGGYGNSLTIPLQGGSVGTTTIYVRSAATAPTGAISGKVMLSSAGATTQQVAVTGFVNALATVNQVSNQTFNVGQLINAIDFTGTGNTFNWVNDTPGIGLAASGTGDIPAFTAANNTNGPLTATITVTPFSVAYAYIANFGSNIISVLDIATSTIKSSIGVGSSPVGVALNADATRLYVANEQSNTVSVVDATNNTVLATIPVGTFPYGIALSPDDKTCYVANGISNTISVISTATNLVTATIFVKSGVASISISPDGSKLFVSNSLLPTGVVSVIDPATNMVVSEIPFGSSPEEIAMAPDGSRIYVANEDSGNVSVINTSDNSVITSIQVGKNPWGIVISPDGSTLYVTNSNDNTVSVINTSNFAIISTIPVGDEPFYLAVSPDGSRVYVENAFGGSISVINTITNTVISTIQGISEPFSLGNFITKGTGCSGLPITFKITVNLVPVITAGPVTGIISACSGNASASPDIQQFTVSGRNLTGSITAAAPAGFEVSLAAANGYSNSVTLAESAGVVNSTVLYVRSAASAPTGNITGQVLLTTPGGADKTADVTAVVNVQGSPALTIATATTNVCAGTQVIFTTTPTSGGGAPAYQWMVNGNNTGTNNATFTSSNLANGDMVNCVITSNAPCTTPLTATSNTITMNVTATAASSLTIATSTNNICAGSPVTFTASPTNDGSSPVYQWLLNGNNTGTNSATYTGSNFVDGDVISCAVTGSTPCLTPAIATSNSITMKVYPVPVISAGGNKSITEGTSIVLNAAGPGNIADVTWSPSAGLSNYKILQPLASPTVTTTYTLTIQTTDGCVGTDMATISVVIPDLVIPNTFTPNGDGINDVWNIKNLEFHLDCTVDIFNRYGEKVFSSIGYGTPWDGNYRGKRLPTGPYYYVINLKYGAKPYGGSITIIR